MGSSMGEIEAELVEVSQTFIEDSYGTRTGWSLQEDSILSGSGSWSLEEMVRGWDGERVASGRGWCLMSRWSTMSMLRVGDRAGEGCFILVVVGGFFLYRVYAVGKLASGCCLFNGMGKG